MYRVIHPFFDLLDGNYYYSAGDTYPRTGKEVSEKRITTLSTAANRQKRALIEKVEENPTELEEDGQASPTEVEENGQASPTIEIVDEAPTETEVTEDGQASPTDNAKKQPRKGKQRK